MRNFILNEKDMYTLSENTKMEVFKNDKKENTHFSVLKGCYICCHIQQV